MDTVTSLTLLEGLRDPANDEAWQRFAARYRPMVISFVGRLGFNHNDAQDIGQETMLAFVKGYREGAYDRRKGRLRAWLFGIAHRKALDVRRRLGREHLAADRSEVGSLLKSLEAPDEAERIWEEEWQRAVIRGCLAEVARRVGPTTMQAFQLYVLAQRSAEEVAQRVGISRSAVYVAKNRVINHLRDLQLQIEAVW